MALGDLPWYLDVAQTIDTIYREELNRPSEPLGNANWIYHAREGGKTGEWIREQVRASSEWHAVHDVPPAPPRPTRDQLLTFRGSLNIKSSSTFNLRGTASTNGIWNAPDDQAAVIIREWKERGYTHGPVGPFIDAGYHGLTPPVDFRNDAQREKVVAAITNLQQEGIITPMFLTPDGWTVDQLRTIEPIFKEEVWQGLGAIVVNGFEQQGSRYGWANSQYVDYLTWMKETFPNAVRCLHTVSGIEAPVGRGDDTSRPGMSLNECWGRLNPLIDVWLTQFDMWDHAWTHVDPANTDGRTDLSHWYDLWDRANRFSFLTRFSAGGTWPLAKDIIPIPGEFWSYGLVWHDLDEAQGRKIGSTAIALGARGSFDGC